MYAKNHNGFDMHPNIFLFRFHFSLCWFNENAYTFGYMFVLLFWLSRTPLHCRMRNKICWFISIRMFEYLFILFSLLHTCCTDLTLVMLSTVAHLLKMGWFYTSSASMEFHRRVWTEQFNSIKMDFRNLCGKIMVLKISVNLISLIVL